MASFNAPDLNSKARHMGGYGNAVIVQGAVSPTAAASADVYRPVRIPAGTLVTDVDFVNDKLDTGTAISGKVGYEPVNAADGPAANDSYFGATSTFLATAGRKTCAFHPIKFEKDVFLIITLTAAATTFAPGKLTAIVKGDGIGVM